MGKEREVPVLSLTIPEVARATGIGINRIYQLIDTGELPCTPTGDVKRVISVDILRAWLIKNARGDIDGLNQFIRMVGGTK